MQLGLQTLQFVNDPKVPVADQLDDLVLVAREADRLGFAWLSASQHWISHPTIWPQPIPLLSHLAAATRRIRLMTQMLLLPLHNPVAVAEDIATLDQLSRGRVTLGIANGYREAELRAAGIERADRAGRVSEGIELLTALWSGEEVDHAGRRWQVRGRPGFVSFQRPRPPIVLAAQSVAAARRAARIADGVFFGPQIRLGDIASLAAVYREACAEAGRPAGSIGAGRALFLADDRASAISSGREYLSRQVGTYSEWSMQEAGTVSFALDDAGVEEWALLGSDADCVAQLEAYARAGLTHVTLTAYNLPKGLERRLDYVRAVGEGIVARAAGVAEASTR